MDKNINIFVSSTFSDMHAERDYIKKKVLPRLQQHFAPKGITINVLDLRWGVDTTDQAFDEEREAKVLSVCLDAIRNTRPFFIGLLGARYGWIPNEERALRAVEKLPEGEQQLLAGAEGCSVTEMEMLYGALGEKSLIYHSYFCMRGEGVYASIPEPLRGRYIDQDERAQHKLRALKEKVRAACDSAEKDAQLIEYECEWSDERHVLTGFEAMGEEFANALIADIEEDFADTRDTMDEEERAMRNFFRRHTEGFCGRSEVVERLTGFLLRFNPEKDYAHGRILVGESGAGKSSVLSKVHDRLVRSGESSLILLAHASGITAASTDMRGMILRWTEQLEERLGMRVDEEHHLMRFEKMLMAATLQGYHPVILIDAFDKLSPAQLFDDYNCRVEEQEQFVKQLGFIPNYVPFLCTTLPGYLDEALAQQPRFQRVELEDYSRGEAEELVRHVLRRQVKELPAQTIERLLEKRREDGRAAYASPLWLKTALTILDEMGDSEFEAIRARQGEREDRKIGDYIALLIDGFHPEPGRLFQPLVRMGAGYFSEHVLWATVSAIGTYEYGALESDIEALIPREWSPLEYACVSQWLAPFLTQDPTSRRWRFEHDILRHSIAELSQREDIPLLHSLFQSEEAVRRQAIQKLMRTMTFDPDALKECLAQAILLGDTGYAPFVLKAFYELYFFDQGCLIPKGMLLEVMNHVGARAFAEYWGRATREYCQACAFGSYMQAFHFHLEDSLENHPERKGDIRLFYRTVYNNIEPLQLERNAWREFKTLLVYLIEQLSDWEFNDDADDTLYLEVMEALHRRYLALGRHSLRGYDVGGLTGIMRRYYKKPAFEWEIDLSNYCRQQNEELRKRRYRERYSTVCEQYVWLTQSLDEPIKYGNTFGKPMAAEEVLMSSSERLPFLQRCEEASASVDWETMPPLPEGVDVSVVPDKFGYISEDDMDFSDPPQEEQKAPARKEAVPYPTRSFRYTYDPNGERGYPLQMTPQAVFADEVPGNDFGRFTRLFIRNLDGFSRWYNPTHKGRGVALCDNFIKHWAAMAVRYAEQDSCPDALLDEMRQAYIATRMARAFPRFGNQDAIDEMRWPLFKLFLRNGRREEARRMLMEEFELTRRCPAPSMYGNHGDAESFVNGDREIAVGFGDMERVLLRQLAEEAPELKEHSYDNDHVAGYRSVWDCAGSPRLAEKRILPPHSHHSRYGYIDEEGREVVPLRYHAASPFVEGLAVVGMDNDGTGQGRFGSLCARYGYINLRGELVLPLRYEYASLFHRGEALVCLNDEWFYIDPEGRRTRGFYGLGTDEPEYVFPRPLPPSPSRLTLEEALLAFREGRFEEAFPACSWWWYGQGRQEALMPLADMLREGHGTPMHPSRALELYLIAEQQGDADARYEAAYYFYNGNQEGVPYNKKRAVEFIRRNVELDHTRSIAFLGFLHLHGYQVEQDTGKPRELLTLAASRKDPVGTMWLNWMKEQRML